jgi:hypothetical protein
MQTAGAQAPASGVFDLVFCVGSCPEPTAVASLREPAPARSMSTTEDSVMYVQEIALRARLRKSRSAARASHPS